MTVMVAATLAQSDTRFAKIDMDLAVLKNDLVLVKWMMGFTLAGITSIAVRLITQ